MRIRCVMLRKVRSLTMNMTRCLVMRSNPHHLRFAWIGAWRALYG